MSIHNRVPSGVPAGGQFAEGRKAEADQTSLGVAVQDPHRVRTGADVTVDPDSGTATVVDAYGHDLQLANVRWYRTGPDGDDKDFYAYEHFQADEFTEPLSPSAQRALDSANRTIANQPLLDGTPASAARVLADMRAPADVRSQALAELGDPVETFDAGVELSSRDEAAQLLSAHGMSASDAAVAGGRGDYEQMRDQLAETGRLDPDQTSRLAQLCLRGKQIRPVVNRLSDNFDRDQLINLSGTDADDERLDALADLDDRYGRVIQARDDFDELAEAGGDPEITDSEAQELSELLGRESNASSCSEASWELYQQRHALARQLREGIVEVCADPRR